MDDKSVQVGGQQRIVTIDGYSMPLICKGGFMYLELQGVPADTDLQTYPSVHLTSPHEWDPSFLDYKHPENNGEPDWAIDPNENFQFDPNFGEFGNYVNRSLSIFDRLDETPPISPIHQLMVNKHLLLFFQCTPIDYEKFLPFFGWVNSDIVKQTIDQTTQWGVALDSFPMKRHLKSRSPRKHKPVATDTIFSDTPAVDSHVKQTQVFVGRHSLVADVYPMKSGNQFVNTLEDNIRRRGAMDKLLSDSAKTEISKKVLIAPPGYQKIRVHLIFAVKYDDRHKARLVADGHLTPAPVESIYSGVVSLRNLKLVRFLGKLNNLELWGADIGNAYLEAPTEEKLYIVAGPEFEDWEGYILTFSKALYGLKSSGKGC